jgi:hypothetical protein
MYRLHERAIGRAARETPVGEVGEHPGILLAQQLVGPGLRLLPERTGLGVEGVAGIGQAHQASALVVAVGDGFDPAVAAHHVHDPRQRRRLERDPVGQRREPLLTAGRDGRHHVQLRSLQPQRPQLLFVKRRERAAQRADPEQETAPGVLARRPLDVGAELLGGASGHGRETNCIYK